MKEQCKKVAVLCGKESCRVRYRILGMAIERSLRYGRISAATRSVDDTLDISLNICSSECWSIQGTRPLPAIGPQLVSCSLFLLESLEEYVVVEHCDEVAKEQLLFR